MADWESESLMIIRVHLPVCLRMTTGRSFRLTPAVASLVGGDVGELGKLLPMSPDKKKKLELPGNSPFPSPIIAIYSCFNIQSALVAVPYAFPRYS